MTYTEREIQIIRDAAKHAEQYVQSVTWDRKYGHDILWVAVNARHVGQVVQQRMGLVPVPLREHEPSSHHPADQADS